MCTTTFAWPGNDRCPNCGACQHCGHGGQVFHPYGWFLYPYQVTYGSTIAQTSGTTNISGNITWTS